MQSVMICWVIRRITLPSVHCRLHVVFLIYCFWIDGWKYSTLFNWSTKRQLILFVAFWYTLFRDQFLWQKVERFYTVDRQVCFVMRTFACLTLFLYFAPKCPCSYQILKYLKPRSFIRYWDKNNQSRHYFP